LTEWRLRLLGQWRESTILWFVVKPQAAEECTMKLARKMVKADVPSVAMGDIAFLLLIFFVILARAEDDSHLRWEPANIPKVENLGTSEVSVLINDKHKVFLNGAPVGTDQLAGMITARLVNRPAGQRKVRLKAHQTAPASIFEPVIEAISVAGGELEHVLEEKREK
jgi:biopolymer transport protein ExbD